MKKIVILENIRSAYNVGNIIRTADALWWEVWMTGYTPTPDDNNRVGKSALWAQDHVPLQLFVTTDQAIAAVRELWCYVIAAEITADAKNLADCGSRKESFAVVLWNEVVGVEPTTLEQVDETVFIPMKGHKESLNVGQTAAIFMWELGK